MTREQRRERDFWLGCAERADYADARCLLGICHALNGITDERLRLQRKAALAVFSPTIRPARGFWWRDIYVNYPKDEQQGRVLAACFLAAMAELGE